jgi:hypothetical protein
MQVEIDFAPDGGKTRVRIERALVDFEAGAVTIWSAPAEQREHLDLNLRLPQHHLRELLGELADIPEILSIEQAPGRQTSTK